jgi:hypothetical protein
LPHFLPQRIALESTAATELAVSGIR